MQSTRHIDEKKEKEKTQVDLVAYRRVHDVTVRSYIHTRSGTHPAVDHPIRGETTKDATIETEKWRPHSTCRQIRTVGVRHKTRARDVSCAGRTMRLVWTPSSAGSAWPAHEAPPTNVTAWRQHRESTAAASTILHPTLPQAAPGRASHAMTDVTTAGAAPVHCQEHGSV